MAKNKSKTNAASKDDAKDKTKNNAASKDVAKDKAGDTAPSKEGARDQGQQLVIHAQYIKDFSFENPGAPQVLMNSSGQPEIEITINVNANPLNKERLFEVVLTVRATAKSEEKNIFITELSYAAIMSVSANVAENALHPIMMIEGPRMIFPFARAILSEITQAGGFRPLNIQPIDFAHVYQQGIIAQQAQQAEKTKQGDA